MLPHVTESPNFNPLQSAYRRHHSTETALLCTLDSIYRSSDAGMPTILISLDLSAAFDMIDHRTLLTRLSSSFGITGTPLSFLSSYLSNRTQSVHSGTASSCTTNCHTGVPQGSVLGPILFSLYVSPISHIANCFGVSLQQYADDTQLYIASSANLVQSSIARFESCLTALHSWFSYNGLILNSTKSEAIIFGTRQRLLSYPSPSYITIENTPVPLSQEITILGCKLDSNLTLRSHISAVTRSAFYHIRALRHIRHSLNDDMAKAVGSSLVQSRLDYANSILCGVAATHLNKLQHIQNSLARAVLPSRSQLSSNQLLRDLHWLPITARIDFKLASITYNTLSIGQPTYLRSLLHSYVPARSLRSSDQQLLQVPRCSTDFGRRAYSHCAPRLWNQLPLHLRLSPSISSFKRSLKSYYFSSSSA